MRQWLGLALLVISLVVGSSWPAVAKEQVTTGSKLFAESWILGEALASLARRTGSVEAQHRSNLGATQIVYEALKQGSVDIYPDYTGTVAEVLLKTTGRPTVEEMRRALAKDGIGMSDPLGFNDGYALGVTKATQERLGLNKISDLVDHPDLAIGFSHEFLGRKDGWPGLAGAYGLNMNNVRGIQHELSYDAIAGGQIEVMDLYTTDPQIDRLGLRMLQDDRTFFPRYDAVLLYRLDLPKRAPEAFAAMMRLVGKIDEAQMSKANALVALQKESQQAAAAALLKDTLGISSEAMAHSGIAAEIAHNTLRHLQLVAVSLLAAILVGVPLGILALRARWLAMLTLTGAGLLQTIPSLALLAFLVPLVGIGLLPALIALFLYSLLPIVRNTYTGLITIPANLAEAAEVIGLSPWAQLFYVYLPMASPSIMAGIKTSAVINVGTATLAALIGAEGLGNPIMQGIALRDTGLILQGAVPAAVLALLVQWSFDLLDRAVIPRGLHYSGSRN